MQANHTVKTSLLGQDAT